MADFVRRASKISRGADSAVIKIDAMIMGYANLHMDDDIEMIAQADEIVIRRHVPNANLTPSNTRQAGLQPDHPSVNMTELLARFDPAKHRHDVQLDDPPIGNETA